MAASARFDWIITVELLGGGCVRVGIEVVNVVAFSQPVISWMTS